MAHVLITSSRQAGLVLPLVQIATALVARGDHVTMLTGAQFEPQVRAAGADFVRLPYDDDDSTPAHGQGGRGGVRQIGRALRATVLEPVDAEFHTALALCRERGIDLIVTEPLFVGAAIIGLLPRSTRPAVMTIGLFPLPMSSIDTAPYGTGLPPLEGVLNGVRNRLLNVLTDRVLLARLRRDFANEVERLTAVRHKGPLLDLALSTDRYAQLSVPQFEYPLRDISAKVRFVGPLPPPPLGTLPSWWDYTDRRPIVHVTQGTYANADPTELIVPTIRALAGERVLVVATTGGRDPDSIESAYGGPLPENARVAAFLPYSHLLAAASVVVTNGGFGAVHHALRWGVPLVVSGTSEDKVEVNARVAWRGVGVDLHRRRPTEQAIRDAVRQVLAEPRFRQASVRIAAAIAGTNAIAGILGLADELIARSAEPATPRAETPSWTGPPSA